MAKRPGSAKPHPPAISTTLWQAGESFIDFGQLPVFGIITLFEDNRQPSNFSPQAARARARRLARNGQSIANVAK
jgi:hypothetical protein